MKPWHPLQLGDTIDIIAPGTAGETNAPEKIQALLSTWGLNSHIPENLFGNDLLCANSDEMRFEILKNALLNPNSKAVWCLRGGYGATRLIPMLSKLEPPKQTKLFIGFSDITALHIFLQQQWGWCTVHGPGVQQTALGRIEQIPIDRIKDIIFGKIKTITYTDLVPLNKPAQQKQNLESTLIGGNLCLVQTSLATPWQINTTNKIILLEEINERGYRIDRMLTQLTQANIFKDAKAVLLGDFTGGDESNGKNLVKEVLQRFADNCSIPVVQCTGIGHGKINNPVPLGTEAKLELGSESKLKINIF